MGLSFHYTARFRDLSRLDEFIQETTDLAEDLNWNCTTIDDEEVKGVVISAENCEPLWLLFTPEGHTLSLAKLRFFKPDEPYYTTVHVKTQYAGPDVHIALIKLLKYLSDKYFSFIEVSDEGNYWDTGDEGILLRQFDRYNFALEMVCEALKDIKVKPGESAESLTDRIGRLLTERFNGKPCEDQQD